MGVFNRLNYNSYSGTNVTDLTPAVKKQMDSLPQLLKPWQVTDIENNNVGGYYKNPVETSIFNVWGQANNIIGIPNLANSNVSSISTAAASLWAAANNFHGHTNRLSGIWEAPESDPTLPTYKKASGVGKMVMYIVYQTDGINNNSPMLGNFSSLYTDKDLNTYANTIQSYSGLIANSLYSVTSGDPIPVTEWYSNLTSTQVSTITTNLAAITSFMNTRRTDDVNFYYNSVTIVDEYNTMKTFNNMGQTQTDMVTNLIGSDKLVTRLNS